MSSIKIDENKTVARLSEMIARNCGIHDVVAKRIYIAAALHDVGKIKLPENIVNKPDKLSIQEFEIIKTHTILGADILTTITGDLGNMVRCVCKFHHEKWDGSGYWGKYTCELPIYVPIVSISDVFVALCSNRCYKEAWPPEKAMDYIQDQAGKQFPPVLVNKFLSLVRNDDSLRDLF